VVQPEGPAKALALGFLEVVEGQSSSRIGNVGRGPGGTQAHANRHVALPELHWDAEMVQVNANGAKMSGGS
jgi:hypothetical protein